MPPTGSGLTADELRILRAWIDAGAAWPQAEAGGHWAFIPPREPSIPSGKAYPWVRNPIDAFVMRRLQEARLTPSAEADRATLLRRLSLDLIGLLPTPAEMEGFLHDREPGAYERQVDRLLASPHFGERWGRHWLDLARYADSDGYEKDLPRPYAYLYRDWVIAALNRDMPFDRFTTEQIAGDLLPGSGADQRIATGFHRNTLKNREGGADPEEDRVKATVDRANTTGVAWLGLSVGCAECHDHKYDPLTQADYFRLYAFFNAAADADVPVGEPVKGPDGKPEQPKAMALAANPMPPATRIHERGDFLRPGAVVLAGIPGFLGGPPAPKDRRDLAAWLTQPENPLTARVAVNRVWQHLFGQGLVATSNDFGVRGDPPSHPELLDWLACRFRGGGADPRDLRWSQKGLIRLMVTSATYRQSSALRTELTRVDPKNRLLGRQNRLRVEAEVVRDLFLQAGGLLSPTVGGPSIRPPLPADIAALGYAGSVKWAETTGPERYKRGMYVFLQRTVPYPGLITFDAPEANVACTRRERSNTPLQALALLNDPVFVEAAGALAGKLLQDAGTAAPEARVAWLYRLCLGRDADPDETRLLLRLVSVARNDGMGELAVWTAVARTVLNLDEFVTRE